MSHTQMNIQDSLDQLCELLDAELSRQQAVLSQLEDQAAAAAVHDVDALDACTAELRRLQHESMLSEQDRLELLRPIVSHYGLTGADQTLSNLVTKVPDPWKSRLSRFQKELRMTVQAARVRSRDNSVHLRGSLRRVGKALDHVLGSDSPEGDNYGARGADVSRRPPAAILDAMG